MSRNLKTCHAQPWALIKRNGQQEGKRPSMRMAYLTGTIALEGKAIALTGYVMNGDMTAWTKSKRRIEWGDVLKKWTRQPSVSEVRRARSRQPIVIREAALNHDMARGL